MLDGDRDNFVCHSRDASPSRPGRKAIQVIRDASRGWALGLEPDAQYEALTLASPGPKEAAAIIDFPKDGVAGFMLSAAPVKESLEVYGTRLLRSLRATMSGQVVGDVDPSVWLSKTHDGYDIGKTVPIFLRLPLAVDVGVPRRQVVAALLGRAEAELVELRARVGQPTRDVVLRLSLIRRFAFLRDAQGKVVKDADGFPKEDPGQAGTGRLLISGALLPGKRNHSSYQAADWKVDDLVTGSLVARSDARLEKNCGVFWARGAPWQDVVVVVDEHGGDDARRRRAANMREFVRAIVSRGLKARFCVVGAVDPKGPQASLAGRCCQGRGGRAGGRFLDETEVDAISSCVADPPGEAEPRAHGLAAARHAVARLLPRAEALPNKVRHGALLTVLSFVERRDVEVHRALAPLGKVAAASCSLTGLARQTVQMRLEPYADYFKGIPNPETRAMFHVVAGGCDHRCAQTPRWLASSVGNMVQSLYGQWAGTCRGVPRNTFGVIADHVSHAGHARTVVWPPPVASSLQVAFDGKVLPRAGRAGFHFDPRRNWIGLFNVAEPRAKTTPAFVSFLSWR